MLLMKYRLLLFSLLILAAGCTKQNAVSDFVQDRDMARSLYFYPSTLRMINIDRNPEYDEMIEGIKLARYFILDSAQVLNADIPNLITELTNDGFEEVMYIKNKDTNIQVMALEKETPEFVILSKSDEEITLLEVVGMINVAKIPKLSQTFTTNGFLDVLNLDGKNNNR